MKSFLKSLSRTYVLGLLYLFCTLVYRHTIYAPSYDSTYPFHLATSSALPSICLSIYPLSHSHLNLLTIPLAISLSNLFVTRSILSEPLTYELICGSPIVCAFDPLSPLPSSLLFS